MKQAISLPYSKMRFIHTADWHLGNQMHDIERKEEYEAFFRFLKAEIVEKKAESLIVAGDVFDTVNPSLEARRLYYTFLASLVDSPCKNVIIVGGNHDSSALLDSAKELLEVLNIRVVGTISNLTFSEMCFELKNSKGEVSGICMALPFVRELELRNLIDEKSKKIEDADLYSLSYKSLYDGLFAEAEKIRAGRNIPLIATGHLYASDLEGRLSEKNPAKKLMTELKFLMLGELWGLYRLLYSRKLIMSHWDTYIIALWSPKIPPSDIPALLLSWDLTRRI
ncbi:MAG: exonuclease subunit SbcD [Treponema sp.]|nr:exonuclease subunit SbcD [Treponema sp.]